VTIANQDHAGHPISDYPSTGSSITS
jgi:hypothetical protein